MADKNCQACNDLRNDAPNLLVNGMTTTEVTSLMNNTGLSPSNGNDDCTDLNNMNDCLIGNLSSEIDSYDVCDWKPFTKNFVENTWTVLKGIISAICGLWTKMSSLCTQLGQSSYIGVLTLYRTSLLTAPVANPQQQLPFEASRRYGNLDNSVLNPGSEMSFVQVRNTTNVPLLIEATLTASIRTEQNFACCYLVIVRDGITIGQTPFITPNTYDQQVHAEPFVLNPGEGSNIWYYFGIGDKNSWFQSQFGYVSGGSGDPKLCLEPEDASDPENQGSYLSVRATSIMPAINC